MIELKNLVKHYTSRKGVVTKALNDLSVSFPSKGLVFILGKSGSGKSTLMNILGGLDVADTGEFIIEGKNIEGLSQVELDHYRNSHVGFVFQDFNIIEMFNDTKGYKVKTGRQNISKNYTIYLKDGVIDNISFCVNNESVRQHNLKRIA